MYIYIFIDCHSPSVAIPFIHPPEKESGMDGNSEKLQTSIHGQESANILSIHVVVFTSIRLITWMISWGPPFQEITTSLLISPFLR